MAADDDTLLAVCRTTYRRVTDAVEDVEMVQLAVVEDLRRAGFEPRGDSPELTFGRSGMLVVLVDGRSIHRDADGTWHIEREGDAARNAPSEGLPI